MNFKTWVKSIQIPGYNGAHMVFIFSNQGSDLAPFSVNGTKIKITSENRPPLVEELDFLEKVNHDFSDDSQIITGNTVVS